MNRETFSATKVNVERKVLFAEENLTKWKGRKAANSTEARTIFEDIQRTLKSVEPEINELGEHVRMVESQRSSNDVELFEKKAFVTQMKHRIKTIHTALDQSASSTVSSGRNTDDGTYVHVLDEQNTILDRFSGTVQQIGTLGQNLNEEIQEQNKLLEQLDLEMEESHTKLTSTTTYVGKLIEASKTHKSWIAIIGLCVLLVVLTILSFAT